MFVFLLFLFLSLSPHFLLPLSLSLSLASRAILFAAAQSNKAHVPSLKLNFSTWFYTQEWTVHSFLFNWERSNFSRSINFHLLFTSHFALVFVLLHFLRSLIFFLLGPTSPFNYSNIESFFLFLFFFFLFLSSPSSHLFLLTSLYSLNSGLWMPWTLIFSVHPLTQRTLPCGANCGRRWTRRSTSLSAMSTGKYPILLFSLLRPVIWPFGPLSARLASLPHHFPLPSSGERTFSSSLHKKI